MLTKEEFTRGMKPVVEVWYKELPSPATLKTYHWLLAHLPAPIFNQAVAVVLANKSYGFPKPSDFIDAAVTVIMLELDYVSEAWARQELDGYREKYLALERFWLLLGACPEGEPMRDAYCKCGIRLSIADPGDLCMFCQEAPSPAPVVPEEQTRKWQGIDSQGRLKRRIPVRTK